jgi:hypothetical protein
MNDKPIKEIELMPLAVVATGQTTKQGSKIYSCTFELQPGMPSWEASAFSDTIAAKLEAAIKEQRKAKIGYTESVFNGKTQYNIKLVDGQSNSGFKKGAGFQKDTVSIERQVAAKLAVEMLQLLPAAETQDAIVKRFNKFAETAYVFISARPSEPAAGGGVTQQKAPDYSDADAPIDLNDLPAEFRT